MYKRAVYIQVSNPEPWVKGVATYRRGSVQNGSHRAQGIGVAQRSKTMTKRNGECKNRYITPDC